MVAKKKSKKNGTFSTLRRFGLFRAFSAVFGRFRPFSGVFERFDQNLKSNLVRAAVISMFETNVVKYKGTDLTTYISKSKILIGQF